MPPASRRGREVTGPATPLRAQNRAEPAAVRVGVAVPVGMEALAEGARRGAAASRCVCDESPWCLEAVSGHVAVAPTLW